MRVVNACMRVVNAEMHTNTTCECAARVLGVGQAQFGFCALLNNIFQFRYPEPILAVRVVCCWILWNIIFDCMSFDFTDTHAYAGAHRLQTYVCKALRTPHAA